MGELTGKVAIVTGASTGIGRAAALALAAEGAQVALMDVDEARGEQVAREIDHKGGRAIFIEADVSDDDAVASTVQRTVDELGGLDIAFNNAGSRESPERPTSARRRTGIEPLPSTSPGCGRACATRSP